MTNYSAKSVDEYIAAAPKEARPHLNEVRSAITSAAPKAKEAIKWGKPYYNYCGMLAGFDAYKNHIGFEIWADELADDMREKLEEKGYKTTKRTFHIRYDQNVPKGIIKELVKTQTNINKNKRNKK